LQSLQKSFDAATLEKDLLKKVLAGNDVQLLVSASDLSEDVKNNLLKWAQSRDSEYSSKRQSMNLLIAQSRSQLEISQSELEKLRKNQMMLEVKERKLKDLMDAGGVEENNLKKLEKTLEILNEDEQRLKKLFDNKFIAKKEWTDKLNEYTLTQSEYETQKAKVRQEKSALDLNWKNANDDIALSQKEFQTQKLRIEEAQNKLAEAKSNLEYLEKERTFSTLNLIVEKDKKIAEIEGELAKAKKSIQFQSLISPANGMVHGLNSNTIGGVVTPAQPLMNIVPDGTPLVVEALLLNKDVGFVAIGQEATVKFDTFQFQKYGVLEGFVEAISPDAFEDEKTGSVYKMKVSLAKTTFAVGGRDVPISPGMTVTAEIKTRKRRIIEFFLDPVIKYAEEGLKLR
jgi:multidrug efflux pump subunit AcrA (membrane-fusion protein)